VGFEPKVSLGTECLNDLAMQIGFVVPRDDLDAAVTVACENAGKGFLGTESLGVQREQRGNREIVQCRCGVGRGDLASAGPQFGHPAAGTRLVA
jgi:hypothetical protein